MQEPITISMVVSCTHEHNERKHPNDYEKDVILPVGRKPFIETNPPWKNPREYISTQRINTFSSHKRRPLYFLEATSSTSSPTLLRKITSSPKRATISRVGFNHNEIMTCFPKSTISSDNFPFWCGLHNLEMVMIFQNLIDDTFHLSPPSETNLRTSLPSVEPLDAHTTIFSKRERQINLTSNASNTLMHAFDQYQNPASSTIIYRKRYKQISKRLPEYTKDIKQKKKKTHTEKKTRSNLLLDIQHESISFTDNSEQEKTTIPEVNMSANKIQMI